MGRAPTSLAERLLEVLLIGGPRKRTILRALAKHWGYDANAFRRACLLLYATKKAREFCQYGGPHLRATSKGGP